MNKPSEPDVEVCEHVRDVYAQFGPVPGGRSRRRARRTPPGPAHAALRLVQREAERGPRTSRVSGCTSAAAISGILSYGVLPSGQRSDPGGSRPHVIAVNSTRSTADFTDLTGQGQLAAGSLASIDATVVVRTRPASWPRWCCLT